MMCSSNNVRVIEICAYIIHTEDGQTQSTLLKLHFFKPFTTKRANYSYLLQRRCELDKEVSIMQIVLIILYMVYSSFAKDLDASEVIGPILSSNRAVSKMFSHAVGFSWYAQRSIVPMMKSCTWITFLPRHRLI